MRRWGTPVFSVALIALSSAVGAQGARDALITKHAAANGVPESLVRRVIWIESRGNPHVVSKGNYGLMQIRLGIARAMGYSGTAQGLLDANTNMTYAVKYLAEAYHAAGCNADRAIRYYQRGYHRARRTRCNSPGPSRMQVVGLQTQTRPAAKQTAKVEQESLPAPSTGAFQPKLVRTISIWKRNVESIVTRTVAKLESEPASPPLPSPKPKSVSSQSIANFKPDPITTQTVGKPESESDQPPPAKRIEPQPPSARKLQAVHRSASKRVRTRKKADAPINLLSFLKKLIAPAKKPRAHKYRSHTRLQAQR